MASTHHILAWTTKGHFDRMVASPLFQEVLGPLKPSFSAPATIYNIKFASDVTVALKKPLTEILFGVVESEEDKQEMLSICEKISQITQGVATYGLVEEKDDVVAFVCGWDSDEASNHAMNAI